jgi:hypothetical protein
MINCYLIKSRVPNRDLPLNQSLKNHPHINVIEIEGYYLSEMESKIVVDPFLAKIRILRNLSVGEIGAALAHSHVQALIAESGLGGVVLEDDARIPNIDDFYIACSRFLNLNLERDILNLYDTRAVKLGIYYSKVSNYKNDFINLLGVSSRNVAYALSATSARKIFNTNYPVYCTPDWPFSSNKHAILLNPVVVHGDELTKSTIDEFGVLNRDKMNSIKRKIRLILFIDYFCNYKYFDNFNQYYNVVLKHRVTFYFDMVKFNFQLKLLFFNSFLSRLIFPTRNR